MAQWLATTSYTSRRAVVKLSGMVRVSTIYVGMMERCRVWNCLGQSVWSLLGPRHYATLYWSVYSMKLFCQGGNTNICVIGSKSVQSQHRQEEWQRLNSMVVLIIFKNWINTLLNPSRIILCSVYEVSDSACSSVGSRWNCKSDVKRAYLIGITSPGGNYLLIKLPLPEQ